MSADFNPKLHGFQFSNHQIDWAFGPFSGKMLCGGMVYAALDYFAAGVEIPKIEEIPPIGTPLHNYIYQRQWAAHKNTGYKFTKYWLWPGQHEEFGKLERYLASGRAIPVCLFNDFGKGHHTIALPGERRDGITISIYDPNFPRVVCSIKRAQSGFRHSVTNGLWRGFFVDDRFRLREPRFS